MENFLLDIFDEIWPITLYYSTGYFVEITRIIFNAFSDTHVHV